MGHAVMVYGVAALLVAASAGPVLAAVRDASLLEFEALDEPRTLNDFPFLQRVEPYLPPLVVDWLIIRPDSDLDLPEDVRYRIDSDGRVILIWPDGCEETQEEFRSGSQCEPDADLDCAITPLHPECLGDPIRCPTDDSGSDNRTDTDACPVEEECPAGEVHDGGGCVPDPACAEDIGSAPDHCPAPEPPRPACPMGHVQTTDDDCIATVSHQITRIVFTSNNDGDVQTVPLELKAHYSNLSLEIERQGFPFSPGWQIRLHHEDADRDICWEDRQNGDSRGCTSTQQSSGSSGTQTDRLIDDQAFHPIPPGKMTLIVEYIPTPVTTTSPYLEVQLFGRPTQHDAG